VPAQCIDAAYDLKVGEEELVSLGSESGTEGLLTLAILTLREDHAPTANLMAPVVIDRKTRRARQVIQYDSGYDFEKPLFGEGS
jgi:flagellar assembly factor FliW